MLATLAVASLLGACTPTFNWREVQFAAPGLSALLPCKPDKGTRTVDLGGRPVELAMQGCQSGGATFAIAWADTGDAGRVDGTLVQWRAVTLANLKAGVPQRQPFIPAGATPHPASVRIAAQGRAPDGAAVESRAVWFARGTNVFHAVIYAPRVTDEMAQPFFDSLKLQ